MRKWMIVIFCMTALLCHRAIAGDTDKAAGANRGRPRVVIVRADWCGYCQQIEPILKQLEREYSDRLDFIALDVTNEKTTAQASQIAKKQAFNRFFAENKDKTSTVAIFRGSKLVFQTSGVHDRATYRAEFERALH